MYVPKKLSDWPAKHQYLVAFLGASLLVAALFGKSLQAEWGIIDDHEIMTYLGPRERLPMSEIPSLLMQKEVGSPGKSLRYRPAYYFLRLMETALWGKNCTLWYLARAVMLAISIALIWLILWPSFGFAASALFLAYLMSLPLWSDIFAKLGPAETYAVFGLALFAFFASRLAGAAGPAGRRSVAWGWAGAYLGAAICIGAKENFVILIFPFAALAWVAIKRRRFGIGGAISSLLVLTTTGLVAGSTIIATKNAHSDIYGHPVGLSIMFKNLADSFKVSDCRVMLLILAAVLGALLYQLWSGSRRETVNFTIKTAIAVAVCALVYSSQFVFYSGAWPAGNRYDFPGILAPAFAWMFAARFGLRLLEDAKAKESITCGLRWGMMAGLCLLIAQRGYSALLNRVADNVAVTRSFKKQLTDTLKILKADPSAALVIESKSVGEYEPIISFARFLRAYGVTNPIFFKTSGYSADPRSPLERQLGGYLASLEANGGDGYSPLAELEKHPGPRYGLLVTFDCGNACVRLR